MKNQALITGSAGLLGKHHAIALAAIADDIFLTDVSVLAESQFRGVEAIYKELKTNFHILYMDVTNEASVCDASAYLENKGYFVDKLINNAALNPWRKTATY